MSDYFLLDPDYKDFPEKGELKFLTVYGEQHTFILLAVLMSIALLFTVYVTVRDILLPDIAYLTLGATAQATVTKTCEDRYSSFTYEFDGKDAWQNIQHYEGHDHATSSNSCPKVGDHIEVFYIQGHPQTSQKSEGTGNTFFSILIFGIISAYGCYWTYGLLQHISAFLNTFPKYKELKQTALIVDGVISFVGKAPKVEFAGRWEGYYIEVTYDFVANDYFFRGKQIKRRNDLRGQPLPPPDTPVRILYADENTYVML